jgi:hypothetical protein
MSCINPRTELHKEAKKASDMWQKNPSIKKWGMDKDTAMFDAMFDAATGKPHEPGSALVANDYIKVQQAITDFQSSLKSPGLLSNKIIQHIFIGKSLARKNPILQRFYDRISNINEFRNSHTQSLNKNYTDMISEFKLALLELSGVNTLSEAGQFASGELSRRNILNPKAALQKKRVNKTIEKLDKLEADYYAAGNPVAAQTEFLKLQKFLLGKDAESKEGVAFQDLFDVIESGDANFLKLRYAETNTKGESFISPEKRRYIEKIINASNNWKKIQVESKRHLENSIEMTIENVGLKFGSNSKTAGRLIEKYTDILNNLKEFDGNYVPHYLLDVLGSTLKVSENLSKSHLSTKTREGKIEQVLREALTDADQINVRLLNRLKYKKSGSTEEYFSRNPLMYAQKYIGQVLEFNHNTTLDNAYARGLSDLTGVVLRNAGTREARTAEVYKKILNDMYSAANGKNKIMNDPTSNNIVRLLTSMQFISKMGFSPRSALRNLTQKALNFGYFGGLMWYDAVREIKTNKEFADGAKNQLERHGLQFIEAHQATHGALERVDRIGTGITTAKAKDESVILSQHKKTGLEFTVEKASRIAEHSSVLTKKVENWNRKSTFNIAYYKRFKQLENSDTYRNWRSVDANAKGGKNALERKAGNYAANITRLLHFDYAPHAKAKWQRTGLGAVLGQFQHYAMSFAQLQFQMLKDYRRAQKRGDYFGVEAGRVTRMGMLYGLTEIASVVANIDFTTYLNNDTLERAGAFLQLMDMEVDWEQGSIEFGNNPEQQAEAFYGKGLVGALSMVPLADAVEIINLGAAAGYWDLFADPESTEGMLLGLREYEKINNTEFGYELGGMLSIELERFIRSMSTMHNHGLIAALRSEFGLYPGVTSLGFKTRSARKKLLRLEDNKRLKPFNKRRKGRNKPRRTKGKLSSNQRRQAITSLQGLV